MVATVVAMAFEGHAETVAERLGRPGDPAVCAAIRCERGNGL